MKYSKNKNFFQFLNIVKPRKNIQFVNKHMIYIQVN
jgi:hypothetical protein